MSKPTVLEYPEMMRRGSAIPVARQVVSRVPSVPVRESAETISAVAG